MDSWIQFPKPVRRGVPPYGKIKLSIEESALKACENKDICPSFCGLLVVTLSEAAWVEVAGWLNRET